MFEAFRRFLEDVKDASAAEHALVLALIALFISGAVQLLGVNIGAAITAAANVIGG